MGHAFGEHWTQEKILQSVKDCMDATGLTRMPSRSELSGQGTQANHEGNGKAR